MPAAGQGDAQLVVVSVSFGTAEDAAAAATALVEQRLVACAQSWPMRSSYRWQGAVEHADEQLLTAKTTAAMLPAVEAAVRALHSYDVPEMIAVPVAWASADYAAWVRESVGPALPPSELR